MGMSRGTPHVSPKWSPVRVTHVQVEIDLLVIHTKLESSVDDPGPHSYTVAPHDPRMHEPLAREFVCLVLRLVRTSGDTSLQSLRVHGEAMLRLFHYYSGRAGGTRESGKGREDGSPSANAGASKPSCWSWSRL